jgi:molybdopterin/thiamine biosynthesis adenylyltransferase
MGSAQEFSRIVATASTLGEEAADRHRFLDKRVLLTGDGDFLATPNGRDCLIAALHLLPRICANVTVMLPAGTMRDEAKVIADAIAFGPRVTFIDNFGDAPYDAILSVGTRSRGDLPWTVVHSDGWLVRVASGNNDLPRPSAQPNVVAALAAASLGVAETFKRLLGVRASRGPLLPYTSWSLFTYAPEWTDTGPAVPAEMAVDVLLAGAGAIGNGVVYLLARLPLCGRVLLVDPQSFRSENLGTCILIGPQDVGRLKVVLADRMRSGRVDARGYHETLEEFSRRLGDELPYPRVVLGAFDNIDGRHAAQDLWPDLLIDGAIGPLLCQVSRHPLDGDIACARCLFRKPPGERAEVVASRATGLTLERASMPDALVDSGDLAAAPPDKRDWLTTQVGKPICSVISEGVARDISDARDVGFEPSVPFVATLASSMMVAELVKASMGAVTTVEPRFQFDVLRGPAAGALLPQERRRDCYCVTRAATVAAWRRQRPSGGDGETSGARGSRARATLNGE